STGEWTWTRKVAFNGEEVTLTEVGDGLSELKKMSKNSWYQVKYDADGNVIEVEPISDVLTEGSDLETSLGSLANTIQTGKDTVLYYQTLNIKNLGMVGKTLFTNTADDYGFRVADEVKIVLQQTVNNTDKTYFESGYKALQTIVDEL